MTSPILFAGQEDLSFTPIGAAFSTSGTHGLLIDTNAAHFRSGYARYAINVTYNSNTDSMQPNTVFARASFAATTQFWWTARVYYSPSDGGNSISWAWVLRDSSGVARLRMRAASSNTAVTTFAIETISAEGVVNQLGANTTTAFSTNPATPDKIDVFLNYATGGTLTIYINGVQIFSVSEDITTDFATSLAMLDLGELQNGSNSRPTNAWSEVIVATQDTRNMSLCTLAPNAAGNTQTWTSSTTNVVVNSGTTSSTYAGSANVVFYSKLTPSSTQQGALASVAMSLNAGVTGTTSMAIYADNNGSPGARLASSSTIVNPTSGIRTYALTGVSITANTSYWVAYLSTASYTANQTNGPVANLGATESNTSFPSTAGASLTSNSLWVQMSFAQPNISQASVNQSSPDFSGTTGQVQEYQNGTPIPSGSFSVVSIVQHIQAIVGSGGPQHLKATVNISGSDFSSGDLAPGTAWGLVSHNWDTNPNTTAPWQPTDLPAGSSSFSFGYTSDT